MILVPHDLIRLVFFHSFLWADKVPSKILAGLVAVIKNEVKGKTFVLEEEKLMSWTASIFYIFLLL